MFPIGLNPDISSNLYNPESINNVSGISSCYQCKKNNIKRDEYHDEIYCFDCGTVLRQAFNDYEEMIIDIKIMNESIGTEFINPHRNKNFLLELIEIQEYKNKIDLDNYSIF